VSFRESRYQLLAGARRTEKSAHVLHQDLYVTEDIQLNILFCELAVR
jgi:hypothetical protein